jgi:dienelactone hydrolase
MPAPPVTMSLAVVEMAQEERFTEIRDLFAPTLRAMVTTDALQAAWAVELDRRGPVSSVGAPVSEPATAGVVVVRVPVTCERGALTLMVSVHESGWLTGLQLAPASAAEPAVPWEPPAYANPEQFDEQDVTVGSGPLAVPGTLSLPRRPEPRPASRGVAVLRFDKVTFAHPSEVKTAHDFTVADEYVPHALAAVHLLGQHPAVDAERIFLLGHSLGGTVAPRVAASDPSVAGLVILAGGAQPLHWTAVRQIRYLASLDPETAAASDPAIEAMSEQARLVDSPDLSPSTPASELPFGTPAPYWLDLRGYDAVAVAAALDRPILILQGGRDYQVTVLDDLARWKTGLAHRADVTFRIYPSDNHFFFPGTGRSTPAECEPAQHVDPAVVPDIAGWLTTVIHNSPRPEEQ